VWFFICRFLWEIEQARSRANRHATRRSSYNAKPPQLQGSFSLRQSGTLLFFCEIAFVLRAQTRFHAFPMSVERKPTQYYSFQVRCIVVTEVEKPEVYENIEITGGQHIRSCALHAHTALLKI
jgi:hypothetical protein